MFKKFAIGACLAAGMLSSSHAEPLSAITFSGDVFLGVTAFYSTRGYEFNVTQAGLKATHLGIYDPGADGLADSHLVGLWTTGGTLVASATVESGTSALLKDSMRYVDIADVALDIGSYIVAAVYEENTADRYAVAATLDLLTAPGISYLRPRYGSCCVPVVLPFPSERFDSDFFGLFGGTLMVDAGGNAVAEPASCALALSALAALAISRRRSVPAGTAAMRRAQLGS